MSSLIKSKTIYSINEFANMCGHFYNAYIEADISANNGYNCRHAECTEKHKGVGCCFTWSCPLAYEADEEDFANPEIDSNGWTRWTKRNELPICGLLLPSATATRKEPKRWKAI